MRSFASVFCKPAVLTALWWSCSPGLAQEAALSLKQVRGQLQVHVERARDLHKEVTQDVETFHKSPAYPLYVDLRYELSTTAARLQTAVDEGKSEIIHKQLAQQIDTIKGKLQGQFLNTTVFQRIQEYSERAGELANAEAEISQAIRQHELRLSGLDFLFDRINELLQAKKELDSRITAKEKELPGQEPEIRLRNATYLANARKASVDMGIKIKSLQAGREKVAAELRKLGGSDDIDQAVKRVQRERDALVEMFNEAHWLVDQAAFMSQTHIAFRTQATVNSVEGAVIIHHRNGTRSTASLNMTFHDGDLVETGQNARIEFYLPDGSQLKVGENSTYVIGAEANRLENGWFRFREAMEKGASIGEALNQSRDFYRNKRFTAHHTALVVKGTDFVMQTDGENTRVLVRSGEVEVKSKKGMVVSVLSGQQIAIDNTGSITPPQDLSEAEFRRLVLGPRQRKTSR